MNALIIIVSFTMAWALASVFPSVSAFPPVSWLAPAYQLDSRLEFP
jgi:hypothetical protein